MRFPSFAHGLALVGAFSLLAGCRQVCDYDSQPQYPLTADQRAWAVPYPKNAELRFRNAAGYVRTYRVTESRIEFARQGAAKSTVCGTHQSEGFVMRLERTDSVGRGDYILHLSADEGGTSPNGPNGPNGQTATLRWAASEFRVPTYAMDRGLQAVGTATVAGRTYQNVVELNDLGGTVSPTRQPWYVPRVLLTKADGVIRFYERGGNVWDRL
ncbi:hypothetical protein [Hymenobacter algoricola]|uniref:Lipoprotein n=1 Tax=Hymenobacter algoricola TaxID=486267 RepID=A0ABP7MH34_9BACT